MASQYALIQVSKIRKQSRYVKLVNALCIQLSPVDTNKERTYDLRKNGIQPEAHR